MNDVVQRRLQFANNAPHNSAQLIQPEPAIAWLSSLLDFFILKVRDKCSVLSLTHCRPVALFRKEDVTLYPVDVGV